MARSASPTVNVRQIEVVLRGAEPPIWRRLQVPASVTLADLHYVLQVAMGWGDCHLHQFTIAGVRYGIDDGEGWGLACKDERRAKLYQVASKGARFVYEYDFGDGWEHDIIVENVSPVEEAYRVCLAGERACPPEDCGGVWGYDDSSALLPIPLTKTARSSWSGGARSSTRNASIWPPSIGPWRWPPGAAHHRGSEPAKAPQPERCISPGTHRRLRVYVPGVYHRSVNQVEPNRRGRINMRVSDRQERVLRAAAELSGETLTGFVLAAATERAEGILERAERIEVSVEAFARFVAALDEPPEDMPTLRRYTRKQSPIPTR